MGVFSGVSGSNAWGVSPLPPTSPSLDPRAPGVAKKPPKASAGVFCFPGAGADAAAGGSLCASASEPGGESSSESAEWNDPKDPEECWDWSGEDAGAGGRPDIGERTGIGDMFATWRWRTDIHSSMMSGRRR